MKDDLAFKEGEMEKSRATGSGLSGGKSSSSSRFPFVEVRPVIRYSAVRLFLLFFPLLVTLFFFLCLSLISLHTIIPS